MKISKIYNKRSFKIRLITAFLVTSIIPIIIINLFSYYNTSIIVKDNVQELTHANLQQTQSALDVWLDSYKDILFQIYMDDNIVDLVEKINKNENMTVTTGQLRRKLRGLFYTKEYIKSITVITENGTVVFYDLLTGSTTRNSWADSLEITQQELYDMVSVDNDTHVISTRKAGIFAADTYYLFHLGHRIIDYKNVKKELGIVVVSIDEKMLQGICNNNTDNNSFNFMVDKKGQLVSYGTRELLGNKIIDWVEDESKRREAYREFVQKQKVLQGEYISIDMVYDEAFQCDIVNVSNQDDVVVRLKEQQRIMLFVLMLSIGTLIILIILLTKSLTGSLQKLVHIMKRAAKGELSARVNIDHKMPIEVETIAEQFNRMLSKVEQSMQNEKLANEKQRNAEIAALEAQINPHFLYNTLDTINWMAIGRDEYEISNSITSLATILRYGIDKSNEIVTVRQECDWLKQYLFLQQTRLKNTFECEMHIAPEVLNWKMHKLLLQPFVENSILHGFEGQKGPHRLEVSIAPNNNQLKIIIFDNGKGIRPEIVENMNCGIFQESAEKNHIGMENAITRLYMYYSKNATIQITSKQGNFTKIYINIPKIEGDQE